MRVAVDHGHGAGEQARLVFFAGAALCGVVGYRVYPASTVWVPVALAAIAVAIWHGAYDGVLAERLLKPHLRGRWQVPFYAAYVGLAAAVLVLWGFAPRLALPLFLLYSAFHFGTEAEPRRTWNAVAGGMALGLVPIAAACHWWPQNTIAIFALMLRSSAPAAATVQRVSAALLLPALLTAVLSVCSQRRALLLRLALLSSELVLFRCCTPVVAFAIFFCLWHTPEHLVETSLGRHHRFQLSLALENLRRGVGPWLISVTGIAIVLLWKRSALAHSAGIVFIALSALTVPHMALALILSHLSRRPAAAIRPGTAPCAVQR